MKVILGSSSARRREVMARMGVPFEVMTADIDEKVIRHDHPKDMVLAIARAKAEALLPRIEEPALLITTDGVVVCKGLVREKPVDAEEARTFLRDYRNASAQAVTAVVVTHTQTLQRVEDVDFATIFFQDFSEQVIEEMVAKGDALKCAGGFNVADPYVAPYIHRIEGTIEGVMGLPVEMTKRLLREAGAKDV